MSVPIKVLVTDDSVVLRRLITDVLKTDNEIEVVGTAVNGKNALEKLPLLKPDIMTLDVEMPVMDGLQTLVEVRKRDAKIPIIMFSTLTARGAGATLDALERGASDYVAKPANVGSVSESMEAVRSELIPKIKSLTGRAPRALPTARPAFGAGAPPEAGPPNRGIFGGRPPASAGVPGAAQGAAPVDLSAVKPTGVVDVVAIGISTGGPDALTRVISTLPGNFPVPIVVTQHMPPVFTELFAQRLDTRSKLRVVEAKQGERLEPGKVMIAPGDWHMRVKKTASGAVAELDQGPQENYCRPAVDPMFRSIAEAYKGNVLAVIMTGMGHDGYRGAEPILAAGGQLIVQDEATSVVWGMPGAAVAAGLPLQQYSLDKLAEAIMTRVNAGRGAAAARPRS
ncbi:protein-glutamate methylesterase/protein-glutamine glutaminase [Dermatophilus congolensis]|uniref:protein-glutamate methylesterase/protein-glutamine glutaminase n=1 Tax=Dermatophilus congolensis TaxID=1863 RepID=UPI001AAFA080|nr:chemotaxis response regulator protein-glutamate methylesterase [Dermatophilus congolensis]MBO3130005.1 chemotaxis response regulator protein-glutamate methylesterase [Dermatophilus congolensis]MBO3131365.1 chemotaxis response regulator protein-glutamate methylesterase [Dermatophilus congolensis]MBO3134479.1 chemotaxis response regulator protein-glutamate methylesterase [Dermatophilus congolensis]MBO3136714.1 chemotaxis response regulator protein-glutamate methylesterase [Dermatophilus congol